jgi:trehalose-phosphatase
MAVPALPVTPAFAARLAGYPLLLFLDIDGTLAPIAPRPELAVVPVETQRLLHELSSLDGVHVVFVTGRAASDGRRLAGVDEGWVIGNHGMEVARPCERARARDDVAPFESSVATAALRVARVTAERGWEGVLVENKQLTLSVHYRLADPSVVPQLIDEVTRVGGDLGLRVTQGKEVLELRPPIAVDKGIAALELAELLGGTDDRASVFAAGDDRTDEDLFRVLRRRQPRAVTVRVGDATSTEAEFNVADTDAMRELLLFLRSLR